MTVMPRTKQTARIILMAANAPAGPDVEVNVDAGVQESALEVILHFICMFPSDMSV